MTRWRFTATRGGKFVPSQIKHGNRGTPKAEQTPYDFSFSGIKTAVLRYENGRNPRVDHCAAAGAGWKSKAGGGRCDGALRQAKIDLWLFSESGGGRPVGKTLQAVQEQDVRTFFVTGAWLPIENCGSI